MKHIVLFVAQSSDGFIATADGGVSWLNQYNDDGQDYNSTFMDTVDINIQGAATYRQVMDFDIPYPYTSKTYVITHHTLPKPEGSDIEFFQGDLKSLATKVKKESKKNIWLIGGADIIKQFLALSLLDEMIIFTMPIDLYDGIPLFSDKTHVSLFTEISSKTYKTGVIEKHYVRKKVGQTQRLQYNSAI